jgi:RHS repeat-associated protein
MNPTAYPQKPDVEYRYNPFGQRVLKVVKTRENGVVRPQEEWKYYYYAYDANGQVMALYEVQMSSTENTATLSEQHIYGASRLGMVKQDVLLYDNGNELEEQGELVVNILGAKRYEITNYLGNVNAVITDRKVYASPGALTVYEAVVMMKADYYPFGMTMPGRHESGEGYRFGYNGMELNPEVSGDGNSYTTEFRQYDPRLGRWLSLDPLMAMFPWMSPYVAFDNNPIYFVDPLGLSATNGGDKGKSSKKNNGSGLFKDGKFDGTKELDEVHVSAKALPDAIVQKNRLNKRINSHIYQHGNLNNDLSRDNTNSASKIRLLTLEEQKQEHDYAQYLYTMEMVNSVTMSEKKNMNHEFAKDMWNRYGDYVFPKDIWDKLINGEEISASDWIIEGVSIIPGAKIFGKAGKIFLKNGDKVIDVSKKKFLQVCFVAGTKITTENGYKKIEDIKVGDLVWAFDEHTGDITLKQVYNTVIKQTNHLEKIVIGSDTLYTTSDHPFWVSNAWKPAGKLEIGDTLTLRNNDKIVVEYREKIDTVTTVYNFAVSDYHTYFVGSQEILVHNNNPCAAAAEGGMKFTSSNIDDAVSLTMKQKELHIFANKLHPKPWLNQLSTQMGGNQNVIKAALENANGRILPNAQGVFNTPVNVGGVNFTIRGYINQGTPIINSIFIP